MVGLVEIQVETQVAGPEMDPVVALEAAAVAAALEVVAAVLPVVEGAAAAFLVIKTHTLEAFSCLKICSTVIWQQLLPYQSSAGCARALQSFIL